LKKYHQQILSLLASQKIDHLVILTKLSLSKIMNDLSKVCKSVSIYPNINEKMWPENDLCLILEDIVLTNEDLGQIKNQLAQKIIMVNSKSDEKRLFELGFLKTPDIDIIFTYNLESYNKKRNWNNADGWANPENFDKYRW